MSTHTPVSTARVQRRYMLSLRAFAAIAWFNLVLASIILGYAAFAGPTLTHLRGVLVLAAPAVFVLWRMKAWRRAVESPT